MCIAKNCRGGKQDQVKVALTVLRRAALGYECRLSEPKRLTNLYIDVQYYLPMRPGTNHQSYSLAVSLFYANFRDIEALLALPGIAVSYETIRQCCKKYGSNYCKQIKKSRGPLSDTWYLDEAFIKINNVLHYLWRAVDQYGDAINIFVHKRKNKKAAMRFFKRQLKEQEGTPLKIITDKLKSYSAVKKQLIHSLEHATAQYEISEVSYRISLLGNKKCRCGSSIPMDKLNAFSVAME